METANPNPGAETQSLSDAASRISAILEPKKTEVKDKPKQEKPKPEKAAKPEPQIEETEELEEVTESEPSDEVEESTEAQETSEETHFERLEELAEALEMPTEKFLQQIKGKVKISGQEKEVTLEEALKGYQLESDYRQKTMELAEQRKAHEASVEKQLNDVKARLNEAGQVAQFYEQQLMGEYNSINWQELRQTNPAEYAALQQDYNQRYQQLQGAKQKIAYEAQRLDYEAQQKAQEQFKTMLSQESAKLAEVIPEFRDPAKADAFKGELRKFLKGFGFNEDEINQVYDHRHVVLIRDAMKYRQLQDKSPQVTTKVKEAPKLLKPGSKQPASKQVALLREARQKLRKSGNLKDAASVIKHFMKPS